MRLGKNNGGFTIIELVLVVALIGILGAMASVALQHARERAKLALYYSDIRQTKLAAQQFEQDVGVMPPDVWRGVDPGLVDKYGWKVPGKYSDAWNSVDLSGWNGPYMKEWKPSPWGGLYDWDNYPPGYNYMGIPGGAVYLTLKPTSWGGTEGLPPPRYEKILEDSNVDRSKQKNVVAAYMGRYPEWNNLPSH